MIELTARAPHCDVPDTTRTPARGLRLPFTVNKRGHSRWSHFLNKTNLSWRKRRWTGIWPPTTCLFFKCKPRFKPYSQTRRNSFQNSHLLFLNLLLHSVSILSSRFTFSPMCLRGANMKAPLMSKKRFNVGNSFNSLQFRKLWVFLLESSRERGPAGRCRWLPYF